jgi:uncharacterized damage-inducible protein DinB
MRQSEILLLYDYNYWATRRLLAATEDVSTAQLTQALPMSWDSVMGTLAHILGAEWVWRMRCQEGVSPTALPDRGQFTTLEVLRGRWQEEEAAMRAYLASLSDDDLQRAVEYKSTRGDAFVRTLWKILVHVVNHGTQHRGEVALYLTTFGHSPGDIDFSVYLAEQGQ